LPRPIFTLLLALVSACGAPAQVTLDAKTGNSSVDITVSQKIELSEMELAVFDGFDSWDNCRSENSAHASTLLYLIDMFNANLHAIPEKDPEIDGAVLMNSPPREENMVAVYLCAGLDSNAFTIHRSVFLSSVFLDELLKMSYTPENAGAYESAVGFVLYHEMGHALLNHSAGKMGDDGFDLPQEIAADGFAYNLLQLTGVGADGAELARRSRF